MSVGLALPRPARFPRRPLILAAAIGCAGATAAGVAALGPDAASTDAPSKAEVQKLLADLPVRFELNQGQAPGKVDYLARGPGYTVSLGRDGAVLALRSKGTAKAAAAGPAAVVGMHVVGGNPRPEVSSIDRLPGTSNYLTGSDRSEWHTDVPSFARVRYEGVYPGVDMVYRGSQKELEYDFIVAPGTDPSKIAVGFKGSEGLSISKRGDLLIDAGGRTTIRQHPPVLFQGSGAAKTRVSGGYVLRGKGKARHLGFRVGAYDRSKALVIDPRIEYSTHLGGTNLTVGTQSSQDTTNGITFDGQGNAYVVGFTDAIAPHAYPTTAGALQTTFGGGARDGFVTKLNPAGNAAVYSTYLGGSLEDRATDVEVDSTGRAFVSGFTVSTNFPTANAIQNTYGGGARDATLSVLNAAGNGLVYSTYVGGAGQDTANRLALDSSNAAYLGGTTQAASAGAANNFPTTAGAFQTAPGGAATTTSDAFVTKVNPAGSAVVYSTFLGGAVADTGAGIDVDSSGNAYVAGATQSTTGIATAGAFDTTFNSTNPATANDAYVAKLNAAGSALIYGTYVGATRADTALGVAVDPTGSAYITGETNSTDFPVKNAAQPQNNSVAGPNDSDSYVTKLNAAGSDTVYSTYNGGISYDTGTDISVDSSGNAYAVGNTLGSPPLKDPVQVRTGDYDSYLTKYDPSGQVAFSTIFGGGSRDFGQAVNADNNGNVYIGGRTDYYSEDSFPTKNAFQPQNGGFGDGWAAKISSTPTSPLVNSLRGRGGPVDGGTSVVLTGVGFTGATSVKFGSTPAASFTVNSPTQITATSPAHAAGKVNVTVTTPAGTTPDNPVTLFEYAEGVWRPTGSLIRVHYDHQMRTLPNGKVLLIGGQSSIFGTTITSTEIYDPKAGTWSAADDLNTPRSAYTVTRLDGPACRTASPAAYCGDLLVAGGSTNSASTNASLNTAEIYDAASNSWTNTTGNMVVGRSQHTATLLDGPECHAASPPAYCGKVLVAAGFSGSNGTPASASLSSAELYDPATGQWTATGAMQHTARQTTSVLLQSGRVLLPGGNGSNRAATEIYNPATGAWGSALPMNVGRERHTVTVLPDGKVLAASGITPGDPPHIGTAKQAGDSAEIFHEATSSWTLLPDRLAAGGARNNHDTAVLPSGKVLLAGGGRGGLTSELFDPSTGQWKSAGLMTISHGSAHPQSASYDTVVISSKQDGFEADSDVCGNNCGKVLVAGNSDTATAELYTPEPKVTGLSPASGRRGTSVTITGQGFTHGVRAVLFGGRPAASFRVDSYGRITAVAPTGGSGSVTVINEGGRATSAAGFALLAEPPIYPPPPSGGCASGTSAGVTCQPNGRGGLTITGTTGANRIVGTTGADEIRCGAGDDVVFAGDGNDVIRCGAGNDTIDAGAGNDQVFGEVGRDRIKGVSGRDRASGGSGNDNVSGGAGNDNASGGSGKDSVSGNSGNDRLSGNSGNDRLSGGSGKDRMSSGSGRDRLSGGSGNDRLNTRDRRGRDTASCGGGGNDRASVDRIDRVRGCERVSRRR